MKLLLNSLCFGTFGCQVASAQDADTILAQSKQAAGGDAWNNIRSISLKSEASLSGAPLLEEQHLDTATGSYTVSYHKGSFEVSGTVESAGGNAFGYDGKTAWEQDTSGYSNIVSDPASLRAVVSASYRARLAYWFPDRALAKKVYTGVKHEGGQDFDDVQITPVGGQPFDFWVDRKTHLINRLLLQEPSGSAIFYVSYLKSGTLMIPKATRYTDGNTAYDLLLNLRQVSTSTVAETVRFGIPLPPKPNYTFPNGEDAVTIPFQLQGNHIFIPIKINSKGPFLAILDTGAGNALSLTLAQELHFDTGGVMETHGLGEAAVSARFAQDFSLQLGDVTLTSRACPVVDMDAFKPIQAFIGYETLRPFVAKIDYSKQTLTLTRPDKFKAPLHAVVLPLRLYGERPIIAGSVDSIDGFFKLDTGADDSLMLYRPFVESQALEEKYKASSKPTTGLGVGGTYQDQLTHIKNLSLGTLQIPNVETRLSSQKSGAAADTNLAGQVGDALLQRFNITLDYGHELAYFEENKDYGKASPEHGSAGFSLNIQDNGWLVTDVIPGSPAAAAGLRKGDKILAVDGQDTAQIFVLDVGKLINRPAGTKVRFKLQTGAQVHDVILTLGKSH